MPVTTKLSFEVILCVLPANFDSSAGIVGFHMMSQKCMMY